MPEPITGSKLPIARHCAWWAREDARYPKLSSSSAARSGTRLHDAFASYVEHKVFPPLTADQRVLADHMREFWGQRASGTGWEAEVSYALDASGARARRLGKFLNRQYGELSPAEIALTVDYQWIENGSPVVGDWKTGYGAHLEPTRDNLQLLAGGAAASMASGLDGCWLELAHVTEHGVREDRYFASALTLHAVMQDIARIQAGIPTALPRAGEHCRYCPALGNCPETARSVGALGRPEKSVVWQADFVSDENDALLVEELSHVKKAIDAIEKSLKERASKKGGIYLPNGKVYKAVLCEKSSLDQGKVAEILGPRYSECLKVISYEQFKQVRA